MLDVAGHKEQHRLKRLRRLAIILAPIAAWGWWRLLTDQPFISFPSLPEDAGLWMPFTLLFVLIAAMMVVPYLVNGRSPHVIFMPEQIEVGFADVKGLGNVLKEVQHTLQVFLDHRKFSGKLGGRPRRGVLFEGPPGTGKTHVAKAMAKEAGVPYLFVSATSFQSMWYGMTGRKIRAFFKALRKTARREGGAIGFLEEIDAIGTKRGGMDGFSATQVDASGREVNRAMSEGVGGVVNELLVQMQSFDEPPAGIRFRNWAAGRVNRFLPYDRRIRLRMPEPSNILLIGATNRAESLDPALLRPGRFDRILHFDAPSRSARRELIDYFLDRKAHDPALDNDQARDELSASTMGYTPASMERLFDEALLLSLREGREALTLPDLRRARMEVEIGLAQPTEYTELERRTIATHEAGHAVVAHLVGESRRLEVLSIIKRRSALGLLAHSPTEERFTNTATELLASIQISMGGMVAEEIFFGESGSGPAGDLKAATDVAVAMVGSLGLGDSLVSFTTLDGGLFGGNMANKVLGDGPSRRAVDRILEENKEAVTRLLSANRHLVEALRDALLKHEELIDDEIIDVLNQAHRTVTVEPPSVVVDLRPPLDVTHEGPAPVPVATFRDATIPDTQPVQE
ncbi:MAG: AAA family ATPase [Acidimicrobiia bacterium]|nr:AAA family ATPase [Acidimicrobiia bacterium]MBT8216386.1 AAA family ATPase [Acidimicrobiia bacterium]NNF09509.1 AAA family ATPase [Acidimicrobiia bacterium]NNL71027.1 AAA family ATPase [Acidimicrobiia bacterium]